MYRIDWKKEKIMILFVVLVIISALVIYDYLPERIPMHWNIKGEVDHYVNKSMGNILILPLTILGLYLLMLYIPFIDKKKEQYDKFLNIYYIIRFSIIIFMGLMYAIIMLATFGYNIPIPKVIPSLVGLLFIFMGKYMGQIRQNSFVGIKLPWTLKNEYVWNKTHQLGGYLFVISGLLTIASTFFKPIYSFITLISSIFLTLIIVSIYSYSLYKKQKDEGM